MIASTHRRDLAFAVSFLACTAAGALAAAPGWKAAFEQPAEGLFDGGWARGAERAVDGQIHFREAAVGFWAVSEYALFREGRAGVVVGDDGWLFTDEEFQETPADVVAQAEKLDEVVRVRGLLAEKGVGLVVAVLPSKVRVHPEQLRDIRMPPVPSARYEQFRVGLVERKVPTVDLRAAMGRAAGEGPTFLRTDTHWNVHGAAAAAEAVAARVREDGLLASVDSVRVELQTGPAAPWSGDLLRFIPLGPWQERLGPERDTVAPVSSTVAAAGGLFDDTSIPVALVGTSFSRLEALGFAPHLRHRLGVDVLNAAEEGRGPFSAMADYLANDAFRQSPPQLVIWEIPERYLGLPLEAGD